nr:KUP/HAK/KT family potassium transporter [uncultured Parolsenella sp.]
MRSDGASGPSTPREPNGAIPFSLGMVLVTLGVVYGDIGTSPMYVMKAIVSGNGGLATVDETLVLGALSLVIWTMTLVTTVKYVVVAMKADNHNEGGIFALYSLVRKCSKWLILPAMIGGAALLADGILTPAVTVTTAVEGLRTIPVGAALLGSDQGRVVVITVAIICLLFAVQRSGTSSIGRAFGPVMTLWFAFLGVVGLVALVANPGVLRALNPLRGLAFLFSADNHAGPMVLGSVFLATTGAEALYSDMGHVGKANIYASWPFVKACLILNYLGQGAWLVANAGDPTLQTMDSLNPFYQMLPEAIRPFAIVLSAVAAIIASQALITGSFTLVSEATRLDLMPHLQVHYPSDTKGQLYIPMVNSIMWAGCVFVVLLFQTSSHMEAAYGLAITLTMLMTTTLLFDYLRRLRGKPVRAVAFLVFFGVIELAFFASSLTKFLHGGYFTLLMAALIFSVMFVWRRGTAIEHAQTVYLPLREYIGQLRRLVSDERYPLLADNLVFLVGGSNPATIDRDVLYSILDKHPKRAKAYWFLNVVVTDEPHTLAYSVDSLGTNFIFRVQLRLGFKDDQRVNTYLRQIVGDLMESGELPPQAHDYSVYQQRSSIGDFRFCMLRKTLVPETDISRSDHRIMAVKYSIRRLCGSPARWYGLENTSAIVEYVPLFARMRPTSRLARETPPSASELPSDAVIDDDLFSRDLLGESVRAARSMSADPTEAMPVLDSRRHDKA